MENNFILPGVSDNFYIGIDPGKSGGVACVTGDFMECIKCPGTIADMAQLLSMIKEAGKYEGTKALAIIESVHSMPKQGVKSTFTFGQNYGQWLGILSALKIPYRQVTPNKWMQSFGAMPKDKKDRKNHIKHLAQQRYPEQKITLATSDAILIAEYCRQECMAKISQSLSYKDLD